MADNNTSTAAAADFRQRGNHEFSAGSYDRAISFYTAGLEQQGSKTTERIRLLCNRSAAYYCTEQYEYSAKDAQDAFTLSGRTDRKAAYRGVKAALQLNDTVTARELLRAAQYWTTDDTNGLAPATTERPGAPDRRAENTPVENDDSDGDDEAARAAAAKELSQQREAFSVLHQQLLQLERNNHSGDDDNAVETTITTAQRPISIREFNLPNNRDDMLGCGNFSEIVAVTHKVTHEPFALKRIAKQQAADLYKRQHPNVYNEIHMERRVLLERLQPVPLTSHIIRMWHAFQDYQHVYYLMDYHRRDVWTQLRYLREPTVEPYDPATVCRPHDARCIMLGAHRSKVVQWTRQLVDALEYIHSRGIVHRDIKTENMLLDAQDNIVLIDFGTAKDLVVTDRNGPEFVGTPDFMAPEAVDENDATPTGTTADLWALGCVLFVLQTGRTPFWSPSPYLAFLKLKRARRRRECAVLRPTGIVDDHCWDFIQQLLRGEPQERLGADAFVWDKEVLTEASTRSYDCLRNHPYLATTAATKERHERQVPSLWDLSVRACAEAVYQESLIAADPVHDVSKLERRERDAVLHCLERRQLLTDPRLYNRFQLPVVRSATRDVVGLTQMNDDEGKPPKPHDPYSKFNQFEPIRVAVIHNPLLSGTCALDDEAQVKIDRKLLKRSIAYVNRTRPHLVVSIVASDAALDDKSRKLLQKISVPSIVHDHALPSFAFWKSGVQCIAVTESKEDDPWLEEQLEQVQMSKHPLFCFGDVKTDKLRQVLVRGRACAIVGTRANVETVQCGVEGPVGEDDDADPEWKTTVFNTTTASVRILTILEEPDQWKEEFLPMTLED